LHGKNSRARTARRSLAALLLSSALQPACANGPFGIDHQWALDQSGIWAQKDQNILEFGAIAVELGGGIYFGRNSPLAGLSGKASIRPRYPPSVPRSSNWPSAVRAPTR